MTVDLISTTTSSTSSTSKSYDLTPSLLPHLDRHLVLPLLDFLEANETHSHDEILRAKYDLMKVTNMVNYVLELKRELGEESDEGGEFGGLWGFFFSSFCCAWGGMGEEYWRDR